MGTSNIIHSAESIATHLKEIANRINKDYEGQTIEIVCLVNGGSVFCADLIRQLTVPINVHQLGFTSYPAGNTSGEVRLTLDLSQPMLGKNILIVEGIVISGRTPKYVYEMLKLRQPASIEICAVGTKPKTLSVDLDVKYSMFEFGSEMIVGYGIGEGSEKSMDYISIKK